MVKSRFLPQPLPLLLFAVVVLGLRLLGTLSLSDTGWSTLRNQWTSAAAGFIGNPQPSLADRAPVDQARFWLREVERSGKARDDPELAMGAAWMLDSPQPGFLRRHVRVKEGLDFPSLPLNGRRELDTPTISALSAEFESLCRDKCLTQMERAVQLDRTNPELRCAQALLVFHLELLEVDLQPRQDNWLSVLDECAQADPDNALYDYLAALSFWKSSADYASELDGFVLKIHNQERYDEGHSRLTAGLKKADLRFGTTGYAATLQFLQETTLSPVDAPKAAESRLIDGRATSLLYRILKWKEIERDTEKRAGHLETAITPVRQILAITEQIKELDNTASPLYAKLILRRWGLANLAEFHANHSRTMNPEEAMQVSRQLGDVQLELEILDEAGRRAAKREPISDTVTPSRPILTTTKLLGLGLFLVTPPTLMTLCVLLALMLPVLFCKNHDRAPESLGWFRHLLAWTLAVSTTFLLLGMFPAEIVTPLAQTWLVNGVLWTSFTLILLVILSWLKRIFPLSAASVAGLVVTTSLPLFAVFQGANILNLAVAAIASLHPAATIFLALLLSVVGYGALNSVWTFFGNTQQPRRQKRLAVEAISLIVLAAVLTGSALATFSYQMLAHTWIKAKVWDEARHLHINPQELQTALKHSDSKWTWAVIQWSFHHGPVLVPLIALSTLMVWQLNRRARQAEGGWRQLLRSRKRSELRQICDPAIKSCVIVVLVLLTIYLGIAPTVFAQLDTQYRTQVARIANPANTRTEILQHVEEIRADEATLTRLQAQVDARNRQMAAP